MSVDYVRYYTAPDTAERFTASFNDKKAGWRHVTIPLDHFKRAAEQLAGASTSVQINERQVWGYVFQAPDGMTQPFVVARFRSVRKKSDA